MKKLLYLSVICVLFGVSLCTSCSIETSDNGKLDGFWQLQQVDTILTGGVTDMRDSMQFWAVQNDLLEIHERISDWQIAFRFEHTGDSLILSNPCYDIREESDVIVDDPTPLNRFGIYHLREPFYVARLSSSRMELKSDRLVMKFRRY